MRTYLVGGAVRDALLGLPVTERDWVVVGANVQEMLDAGYRQVGRDFPVFLHPKTKEEHALARTERKQGVGYKGFVVYADPSVTLEEDLTRRDLTINAIAQTKDGVLVDPFGGQRDLAAKLLRHVSPAFVEDPLRVLRVARFAARFAHLGFQVAPETLALMRTLSQSGELEALTAERVWQEFEKALNTQTPQKFLTVLKDCDALPRILPEVAVLFDASPTSADDVDTTAGMRTLAALQRAAQLTADPVVRFAALVHLLGTATPATANPESDEATPEHGAALVDALAQRLRVPNEHRDLGLLVCRYQHRCHQASTHSAEERYRTLELTDALRRPQRFEQFLLACEATATSITPTDDANARGSASHAHATLLEHDLGNARSVNAAPYTQAAQLRQDLSVARAVDVPAVLSAANAKGTEAATLIRTARIASIAQNAKA